MPVIALSINGVVFRFVARSPVKSPTKAPADALLGTPGGLAKVDAGAGLSSDSDLDPYGDDDGDSDVSWCLEIRLLALIGLKQLEKVVENLFDSLVHVPSKSMNGWQCLLHHFT